MKIRKIIVIVCTLIMCLSILFIFYNFGIMNTPIKVFEGVIFSLLFPSVMILVAWFAKKVDEGRRK